MVVGEEIFAVAIHAGSETSDVDWRSDFPSLTYEVMELPEPVAKGLRMFMSELDPPSCPPPGGLTATPNAHRIWHRDPDTGPQWTLPTPTM